MPRRLLVLLVLGASEPVSAQVARPLGVGVQRAAMRSDSGSGVARRVAPHLSEERRSSVWPWVGVGVLGGALVGGVVAAAQVARTDDAFFPGLAVGAGVVAGALGGGLLGAFLYVITRR